MKVKRKIARAIPLAALALSVTLLISGCFIDRSGTHRAPPIEFDVVPAYICPLEPITVSWNVPTGDPCWIEHPADDDRPPCSTIEDSMSSNTDTPFNDVDLHEIAGIRHYPRGPSVDTSFSIRAVRFGPGGIFPEDLSVSVDVIDVPTEITLTAPGVCGDNAPIELAGILSQCVEINEICIDPMNSDPSADPTHDRYVLRGWVDCLPGTTPDSCLASSFESEPRPAGACVDPEEVGLTTFQGLTTVDIDWRPAFDLDVSPGDCTVEGSGYNPDLDVIFRTSCTGAYAGCATGMGGGGDEEEVEPPPTAAGSQPTLVSSVTPDTSQDLCSEHGGIQFQGEVCVCAGFVDEVTICNDGVKIDQVTDIVCTPDPDQCSQDDGSKPDDDQPTCQNSCGNQSCQPECGEDPNNCPSDC